MSSKVQTFLGTKIRNKNTASWLWSNAIEKLKVTRPTSNASYDKFIEFWRDVLTETSKRGWLGSDTLCIDYTDQFHKKFTYDIDDNGILSPPTIKGLSLVLQELCERGELIRFENYKSSLKQSWSSWIVSKIILGPMWWGYERAVTGIKDSPEQGKYVVMSTVLEAGERIIVHHADISLHGITDDLYTLTAFKEQFADVAIKDTKLSNTDWDILLTHLEYERQVLIARPWERRDGHGPKNEIIIKFRPRNVQTNAQLKIDTTLDYGILTVKTAIESLNKQITNLRKRIDELKVKVNYYVGRKQRGAAKSSLKQEKDTEQLLEKRMKSLHILETIQQKIQQSATYTEVLEALNIGSSTLKDVLDESGLTVESINETMDKLEDSIIMQQEIDDAIETTNESINSSMVVDDMELEKQLEELLKIDKKTRPLQPAGKDTEMEELERMINELNVLPSPPSQSFPVDVKTDAAAVLDEKKQKEKEDDQAQEVQKQKLEDEEKAKDYMFLPAY